MGGREKEQKRREKEREREEWRVEGRGRSSEQVVREGKEEWERKGMEDVDRGPAQFLKLFFSLSLSPPLPSISLSHSSLSLPLLASLAPLCIVGTLQLHQSAFHSDVILDELPDCPPC